MNKTRTKLIEFFWGVFLTTIIGGIFGNIFYGTLAVLVFAYPMSFPVGLITAGMGIVTWLGILLVRKYLL